MTTNITWYIAIVFVALFLILYLHYVELLPSEILIEQKINPISVATALNSGF